MPIERIVFWEPTVSPHKFPFFEAIAESCRFAEVVCIAQALIAAERIRLGWTVNEPKNFKLIVNPEDSLIREVIGYNIKGSLHVFSGMRHVPCIILGIKYAIEFSCSFSLMTEPRNSDGFFGVIRYFQSWISEGRLRKNASFILAIGRNGPLWFKSVGYLAERIYPFAYFVDPPTLKNRSLVELNSSCKKVAYVGRLVKEKGVFDLLSSFAQLDQRKNQLLIVGDGIDRERLMALSIKLSVNCIFAGAVPITEVPDLIDAVDLLVLPSKTTDDGWGVVVSEALLLGVPVVASDMAGASILLDDPRIGRVFKVGDISGLTEAITETLSNENGSLEKRSFRSKWARSSISARAGAKYFISIVDHVFGSGVRPVNFYLNNISL